MIFVAISFIGLALVLTGVGLRRKMGDDPRFREPSPVNFGGAQWLGS